MTPLTEAATGALRSPAFKLMLIGTLILLLLIPLLMVMGLVDEREGRARSVDQEIARYWGGPQHISGPFLIVPYTVRIERTEGSQRVEQIVERRAVFLPEALKITGASRSTVLHRSIYDVNVYTADATLEGRFLAPNMVEVDPEAIAVRWSDAILALGISGVTGLKEATSLEIDGAEKIPFAPSTGVPGAQQTGIHARLGTSRAAASSPDGPTQPFSFRIPLAFSGSASLMFSPSARETSVAIQSDWPHPSFTGAFLPAERDVRPDGFSASWQVPHLARSVPNAWSLVDGGLERLAPYQFGTSFYTPVDFYDLVSRAVKYGLLFLAFGFTGVFMLELFSDRRVHPMQYLFTGLAMVLFYVLLLSLSEHIGFGLAYAAASLATGGMLSLYVGKVLESWHRGVAMLALFLVIYGFLYMILRLEDYALLAGALLSFAALTTVMFTTLKIDWSSGRRPGAAPRPPRGSAPDPDLAIEEGLSS